MEQRASATRRLGKGVVIGAGAKILGPILVGDGAKIGSQCRRSARRSRQAPRRSASRRRILTGDEAQRRESHAAKMGFSAYAIAADMNDPMAQAIHRLIDHAAETDARMQELIAHLKQGGVDVGDAKATAEGFDPQAAQPDDRLTELAGSFS